MYIDIGMFTYWYVYLSNAAFSAVITIFAITIFATFAFCRVLELADF